MTTRFDAFFRSSEQARDKYLSRLFALFSEEVVRIWCASPQSPYENLGRPTIYELGMTRGSTIDFTLRERNSGKTFVSELKCELEYDNYRYLRLTSADQVIHHTSTAFQRFLQVAENPAAFEVRCKGAPMSVDGAILFWGAVAPEGREAVMNQYSFADVLSVEAVVADLQEWNPEPWRKFVDRYRGWTNELFDFLA